MLFIKYRKFLIPQTIALKLGLYSQLASDSYTRTLGVVHMPLRVT